MASDITLAELAALGLRAQALASVSEADQLAACEAMSAKARAYVRARYGNVGAITDPAYKSAVAQMATLAILSARGFSPEPGTGDEVVVKNSDASVRFLRDVANGVAHLDIPEDEADTFAEVLPAMSDPPRGW